MSQAETQGPDTASQTASTAKGEEQRGWCSAPKCDAQLSEVNAIERTCYRCILSVLNIAATPGWLYKVYS